MEKGFSGEVRLAGAVNKEDAFIRCTKSYACYRKSASKNSEWIVSVIYPDENNHSDPSFSGM